MPRTKRPPEWERLKLRVQPTPRNNWGDNLAHLLYKDIWDKLRREVYKKADYRCEICGTTQVVFHCHENWGFNEAKRLHFLVSLQCLCPECHNTIHYYRTMAEARKGNYPLKYLDELEEHFCWVNGVDKAEWLKHLNSKSYLMQIRNDRKYKIDYKQYSIENITRIYSNG